MLLPSSHSCWFGPGTLSAATMRPSPHAVAQAPPPAGQTGSLRQKGEQPSPMALFMSSHCSLPSTTLLPQVVVVHVVGPTHPLACVAVVHFQPSGLATPLLS